MAQEALKALEADPAPPSPSDAAMDERAFGDAGRYYSANQSEAMRAEQRRPTPLERRFGVFLDRHDHGLKLRVERGFKQWNNVLRDSLRNETGLRLTVGDDSQAVPVRIVDGLPKPFAEIVEPFDENTWALLLNRALLRAGAQATRFLRREFGRITGWLAVQPGPAEYDEVRHVEVLFQSLLKKLRSSQLIERIKAVQEDVLGAYFFHIPQVQLYWMVIGFLAGSLGVPVEALTFVTAVHELAYAYTHLGRDIDGKRWKTENFAAANLPITEGLAQFYTKVICQKLEARFPGGLEAYSQLARLQSEPYLVHEGWMENGQAGEVIRISMITCRSKGITRWTDFESMRKQHALRLGKQQA